MKTSTSDYEAATFIIRLWREVPEDVAVDRPWRGTAVHVQTGTERGVQGMDDLLAFMQTWVQIDLPPQDVQP